MAIANAQGTFAIDPDFLQVTDKGANTYDPDTIYVTDGTKVYVTKNHGLTWTDRTSRSTGWAIVDLEVDPRNRDTIYAVRNRLAAVRSTDRRRGPELDQHHRRPAQPARLEDRGLDPRNGNLYVGHRRGRLLPAERRRHELEPVRRRHAQRPGPRPGAEPDHQHASWPAPTAAASIRSSSSDGADPTPVSLLSRHCQRLVGLDRADPRGDPGSNTCSSAPRHAGLPKNGIARPRSNIVGPISDLAGTEPELIKIGLGDVIFSGTNDYGGITEVARSARIIVHNPQALGTATPTDHVDERHGPGTASDLEPSR